MPGSSAPCFTVIIPTLDRLPMLKEAVASVRAQTLGAAELELIVVDDGSSDGTWTWLSKAPGLIPLRHEARRGPSAARNLGAARARGTYLAFLDSDDLWLPGKLQRQQALLEADPACPLCHSNETWIRDGRPLKQGKQHLKKGGWIFEHCLPMCRISPSAAVIRRDVFWDLGGFDEDLEVAEDYELWLRLTCRHPVAFAPEPLTIKRGGHPGQLSAKYGQIEKFRIEALRRVLAQAPLTPTQREAAQAELARKCEVFARGCEKRGRPKEAAEYRNLSKSIDKSGQAIGVRA